MAQTLVLQFCHELPECNGVWISSITFWLCSNYVPVLSGLGLLLSTIHCFNEACCHHREPLSRPSGRRFDAAAPMSRPFGPGNKVARPVLSWL